jgi:hypothetical protein
MKIIILTILFLLIKSEWITNNRFNNVNPSDVNGYHIDQNSMEIKFRLSCSFKCDMYLLTEHDYNKLVQKVSFSYFWGKEDVLDSGFVEYEDYHHLKRTE